MRQLVRVAAPVYPAEDLFTGTPELVADFGSGRYGINFST
jgi:hypothetical protein